MKLIGEFFEYLIDEIIKQLYGLIPVNVQMLIITIIVFIITISIILKYRASISIKWALITFFLLLVLDPLILYLLSAHDVIIVVIAKLISFLMIGYFVIFFSRTKIVTPVTASLIYTIILFLSNANYISETINGGITAILLPAITVILTNMLVVYLGAYFATKVLIKRIE